MIVVALCAIVVPALAGMIAGGIAAPEPPPPRGQTIGGRNVALFVPPSWRRVERGPTIPGLAVKGGIALAPAGRPGDAGLVAGQVSTGGQGPLPPTLLRRVRGDLRTEVVGVGVWDGYRYRDLRVAGFAPRLVLYAVPTASGAATVACYATPRGESRLPACERIARSLEIVGGSDASPPDVSRDYGRAVSAAISRLDARRTIARAALSSGAKPGRAAAASRRLSQAYAAAARPLADVTPPAAAGGAHAALVKRLWRARDAYRRLAAAAKRKDVAGWSQAREAVRRTEARVSAALGDLGALGYGRKA
jgi:hypothetical protein